MRTWTLSRFPDPRHGSWVCQAIGPRESSSCAERIEVVEAVPLGALTWPGHDVSLAPWLPRRLPIIPDFTGGLTAAEYVRKLRA